MVQQWWIRYQLNYNSVLPSWYTAPIKVLFLLDRTEIINVAWIIRTQNCSHAWIPGTSMSINITAFPSEGRLERQGRFTYTHECPRRSLQAIDQEGNTCWRGSASSLWILDTVGHQLRRNKSGRTSKKMGNLTTDMQKNYETGIEWRTLDSKQGRTGLEEWWIDAGPVSMWPMFVAWGWLSDIDMYDSKDGIKTELTLRYDNSHGHHHWQ